MRAMDDATPPTQLPAPPEAERCYRHPDRETLVHCTRCGRPICPECMIPAPVGHHCPECVAEAKREFRQGAGRRIAIRGLSVTRAIMAITIAAGEWWRLFSPMLLHIGLLHLALNMYALYLFGPQVERDFGKTTLIVIYLVAGFAGNVAEYAFGPVISVGAGASGAIFGLLGAFLAYYYRRRHTAVGRFNVQWVWQILILNVVLTFAISGIGYLAHLGGFVAGIALGTAFDRGSIRQRSLPWAATVALVVLGIALVMWKTPQITSQLGL
jgi:membrane associated rhomboid family serine protease